MNYIDNVDIKIKEYFNILEPDGIPDWCNDYINTLEMLHQQYISITCATIYSNLFNSTFFYSNLDHAIGVMLIIYHFTHDKKQALSGLFHDIATPVFKHCVDFMNGDYISQESTEDLTTYIIENSKKIMELLNRDNIKVSEVDNYHLYPIADNDIPKLSADRLEYSLANALLTYNLLEIDDIRKIYNDIEIQTNENGIIELGFKTLEIARIFIKTTSELSIIYRDDRTRYTMQFIADILKRLSHDNIITTKDLYTLKESEVIKKIEESKYKEIYNIWKNATKIKASKEKPENVYFVHCQSKVRYINPLVNYKRITEVCPISKEIINSNLNYDMSNYIYLDFSFDKVFNAYDFINLFCKLCVENNEYNFDSDSLALFIKYCKASNLYLEILDRIKIENYGIYVYSRDIDNAIYDLQKQKILYTIPGETSTINIKPNFNINENYVEYQNIMQEFICNYNKYLKEKPNRLIRSYLY